MATVEASITVAGEARLVVTTKSAPDAIRRADVILIPLVVEEETATAASLGP
jgi:hypothetical protein